MGEVNVTGAKILFTADLPDPIPDFVLTESVVNMWIIMAVLFALVLFLTHNMKVVPTSKRQIIAEKLVDMCSNLVDGVMGDYGKKMVPYIGTLFTVSIVGSLSSLVTMRPYTSDYSVVLAFALVTFVMIEATKFKTGGVKGFLKSFVDPVPFILPLNLISEVATPVSLSFRHYGNIAAGGIITKLVYAALASLSATILKHVTITFIATIPFLQLGIPAILSLYFDLFSSFLQAYIICMLTMAYVSNARCN